jgi:hypothetical protein
MSIGAGVDKEGKEAGEEELVRLAPEGIIHNRAPNVVECDQGLDEGDNPKVVEDDRGDHSAKQYEGTKV